MNKDIIRASRTICIHFLIVGFISTGCSSNIHEKSQRRKDSQPTEVQDPLFIKANNGDPQAQYQVGRIFYEGNGVRYGGKGIPEDYSKAVEYFTKSAEQGHARAQNDLGLMYLEGRGIPENPQQASKWLTKAAEQNLPEAQYHLSSLFARGQGVPQDEDIALDLLTNAAQAGYVQAQYDLGIYYIGWRTFPFQAKNHSEYFQAIYTFSKKIHTKKLNEQDVKLGFSWLEKAKEQGSQKAANSLKQLALFRYVDFETGRLDINSLLSEVDLKELNEMFGSTPNELQDKENLPESGQ